MSERPTPEQTRRAPIPPSLDTVGPGRQAAEHTSPTPSLSAALPPTTSDIPAELAGLQGYEIIRELGRGGMGVVYLSRNTLMDRYEVLKVMNKTLLGQPEAVDRFLQEIRSAAKLSHPNVAIAHSAYQTGELLVLAMEYVDGEDLAKVVREQGPLAISNACFCAHQVATALQRGHDLGMVHRDIKPGNILLSLQGKRPAVKVIDFGLAKAKSELRPRRELTGANQMMGTPGYSAPEQLNDAKIADIRSDIYALGCTLYFLLAGKAPFKGDSVYAIFLAQESGTVRPLRELRPDVPEDLAQVVATMMARDPAERFQQPRDAAVAVSPFLKRAGVLPPRDGDGEQRRTETRETQVRRSSRTIEPKAGSERSASGPSDGPLAHESRTTHIRKTDASRTSLSMTDQRGALDVMAREKPLRPTPLDRKKERALWEDVVYCLDNIKNWALVFAGVTVVSDAIGLIASSQFVPSLGGFGLLILLVVAGLRISSIVLQLQSQYLLIGLRYNPANDLKRFARMAFAVAVVAGCLSALTEELVTIVLFHFYQLIVIASVTVLVIRGVSNLAFARYLRGVAVAIDKQELVKQMSLYMIAAPWVWLVWPLLVGMSLLFFGMLPTPGSPSSRELSSMPAVLRFLSPIGIYVTTIWYLILMIRVRKSVDDHLRGL
jgi:serine/threonine protein kinase